MQQIFFEIIFTGCELITGKILNTNSQWLAQHITKLGGKITRMTVVPDDLELISSSIKETLSRAPDFLIISGGLGCTFDDMTLQAVSHALGIPLILNSEALKYIEEKYEFAQKIGLVKDSNLTKYRKKMAYVPENAKILYNQVGAAPGVVIENKKTRLICLPGVPAELKSIFKKSIVPLIRKKIGDVIFIEESIFSTGFIESEITHVVDRVMNEVNEVNNKSNNVSLMNKSPQVWIKTLVKAPHKKIIIEFYISCFGPEKITKEKVANARALLEKYIKLEGGVVHITEEEI